MAPPEAYLTLIDLRDVVRKNWDLFGQVMEQVSGLKGKENATKWIVEVNEIRKLWAHPIRQEFRPILQDDQRRVRELIGKLQASTRE